MGRFLVRLFVGLTATAITVLAYTLCSNWRIPVGLPIWQEREEFVARCASTDRLGLSPSWDTQVAARARNPFSVPYFLHWTRRAETRPSRYGRSHQVAARDSSARKIDAGVVFT